MIVTLRLVFALLLIGPMSATALAADRNSRSGGGGGSRPAARAPQTRPVQQSRPAPANQGFNLNHDVNARPRTSQQRTVQQPATTQRTTNYVRNGNATQRSGANFPHAANAVGRFGPYTGSFHGNAIANPRHWSGAWGWNRGFAWQIAPNYWGGGFWGPWAIISLPGIALYGSIVDYSGQVVYPSYQVELDSPGAQLLQNYGLQQTPCGPPDLVVIWGPDNSVICAYPNNLVGPGNYGVDPSSLTLISQAQ
jgi:hypothetical protein